MTLDLDSWFTCHYCTTPVKFYPDGTWVDAEGERLCVDSAIKKTRLDRYHKPSYTELDMGEPSNWGSLAGRFKTYKCGDEQDQWRASHFTDTLVKHLARYDIEAKFVINSAAGGDEGHCLALTRAGQKIWLRCWVKSDQQYPENGLYEDSAYANRTLPLIPEEVTEWEALWVTHYCEEGQMRFGGHWDIDTLGLTIVGLFARLPPELAELKLWASVCIVGDCQAEPAGVVHVDDKGFCAAHTWVGKVLAEEVREYGVDLDKDIERVLRRLMEECRVTGCDLKINPTVAFGNGTGFCDEHLEQARDMMAPAEEA